MDKGRTFQTRICYLVEWLREEAFPPQASELRSLAIQLVGLPPEQLAMFGERMLEASGHADTVWADPMDPDPEYEAKIRDYIEGLRTGTIDPPGWKNSRNTRRHAARTQVHRRRQRELSAGDCASVLAARAVPPAARPGAQ